MAMTPEQLRAALARTVATLLAIMGAAVAAFWWIVP
jgi:hypothetical protein